ncbi:MAG: hypothetical protein ABIO02_03315, partial [Patescibacteria group bacterium]
MEIRAADRSVEQMVSRVHEDLRLTTTRTHKVLDIDGTIKTDGDSSLADAKGILDLIYSPYTVPSIDGTQVEITSDASLHSSKTTEELDKFLEIVEYQGKMINIVENCIVRVPISELEQTNKRTKKDIPYLF